MADAVKPDRYKKPDKIWIGDKNKAHKFLGNKKKLIKWAVSVKPGDYIGTCEGANRKVEKAEYLWVNVGLFRNMVEDDTWVLNEVLFTDTKGRLHYCPGGGCAGQPESLEEIKSYFEDWIALSNEDPDSLGWDVDHKFREYLKKVEEAFNSGSHIVDEYGEFLPAFDRT